MADTRTHVTVTGRVQGVGFRASVLDEARTLGLAGWVRNTTDGSVELEAEGDAASVERLLEWLQVGPTYARVEKVDASPITPTGDTGFDIRY